MARTCTITKAGRSDSYGRPLLVGQTYTAPDDEVISLWQAGFATIFNSPTTFLPNKTIMGSLSSSASPMYLVKLTQAEYLALAAPDTNTLYVIVG